MVFVILFFIKRWPVYVHNDPSPSKVARLCVTLHHIYREQKLFTFLISLRAIIYIINVAECYLSTCTYGS